MVLIKNGTLLDPATGANGMFDMLIDGERISRIGFCGSLDDMASESMSMKLMGGESQGTEEFTEIDAAGCDCPRTGGWACALQGSRFYI